MSKKYRYEQVVSFFQKRKMKLLNTEYKNNLQKLKYKCLSCKYTGTKTLNNLLAGKGCPSCSGNIIYTYEQVEQFFLNKNLKLLSDDYKNNSEKLKYKCLRCRYEGRKRLNSLNNGAGCPSCAGNLTHTYKQVKILFKNKGLRLLSTGYKNSRQKLEYRCLKCNYVGTKALKHLAHDCNWYKMDLTEEDRINRRNIPEYREWAKKVKKKDNYICQKCKIKGNTINSHHKNGWNKFPEQRYLITNGITLCKKCHIEFHKEYGKGDNTEFQTYLFLGINKRRSYD